MYFDRYIYVIKQHYIAKTFEMYLKFTLRSSTKVEKYYQVDDNKNAVDKKESTLYYYIILLMLLVLKAAF